MPKYYIDVALEDEYDKKARLRGYIMYVQQTKVLLLLWCWNSQKGLHQPLPGVLCGDPTQWREDVQVGLE